MCGGKKKNIDPCPFIRVAKIYCFVRSFNDVFEIQMKEKNMQRKNEAYRTAFQFHDHFSLILIWDLWNVHKYGPRRQKIGPREKKKKNIGSNKSNSMVSIAPLWADIIVCSSSRNTHENGNHNIMLHHVNNDKGGWGHCEMCPWDQLNHFHISQLNSRRNRGVRTGHRDAPT